MIEIIYKGEDEAVNKELEIKLPKNIRQIGECEHSKRVIYVEDFVMTYVNHFSSRNLKYGVLLGNIQKGNGHTYIFITGAVTANAVLDNELVFDEDVWTGIYEEIKLYFENVEIVGWFASMPSLLNNDFAAIEKLHIDHFAGEERVCFLLDREEGDENFFLYEQGGMKKSEGFFIYYEKNMDMQSYMAMHVDKRNKPEAYEQSHKRVGHVNVHDLLFAQNQPEPERGEMVQGFGKFMKQLPSFAYSASSFMLIAVLAGTVAVMNASGQLKELKTVVNGLVGTEQETTAELLEMQKETVKVIEVEGEVSKQEILESGTKPTEVPNESKESTEKKTDRVTEKTTEVSGEQQTESVVTSSVGVSEEKKTEQTVTEATEVPGEQKTEASATNPTGTATEQKTEQKTEQTSQAEVSTEQNQGQAGQPSVESSVSGTIYYVVEKGDSLYDISMKKYGTISMIGEIAKANNLKNENLIQEGETIVLP